MNTKDMFTSNYLKPHDLRGGTPTVIMNAIEAVKMGDDTKFVLSFQGKEKGLILNKTNCSMIEKLYGEDTDGWMNKPIMLITDWTQNPSGQQVECIRVRPPAQQQAQPATQPHTIPDEDIPPF